VVGPGLRPGAATVALVTGLLAAPAGSPGNLPPVLVDAEAVNALATVDRWWEWPRLRPCVLTPHVGEFHRLRPSAAEVDLVRDDAARRAAALEAAALWGRSPS